MTEYEKAEEIYQSIEKHGLLSTLKTFFGDEYEMQLPFYDEARNLPNRRTRLVGKEF